MCICINCKFVSNCSIYSLIEKQHSQINNLNKKDYSFVPHYSVININIIAGTQNQLDWDIIECLSYTEEPGKWLNKILF